MGHLSDLHHRGRIRPRRGSNKDPLRKIVTFGEIETLECGHEQRQVQDLIGPTNAVRRRCHRCAEETK